MALAAHLPNALMKEIGADAVIAMVVSLTRSCVSLTPKCKNKKSDTVGQHSGALSGKCVPKISHESQDRPKICDSDENPDSLRCRQG